MTAASAYSCWTACRMAGKGSGTTIFYSRFSFSQSPISPPCEGADPSIQRPLQSSVSIYRFTSSGVPRALPVGLLAWPSRQAVARLVCTVLQRCSWDRHLKGRGSRPGVSPFGRGVSNNRAVSGCPPPSGTRRHSRLTGVRAPLIRLGLKPFRERRACEAAAVTTCFSSRSDGGSVGA